MQIWIEAEHVQATTELTDDNSDVVVTLEDASRWAATFMTYRNVETVRRKNTKTGECLAGRYLWVANLIMVDMISRPAIEAVVADLRATDEFERAFQKLVRYPQVSSAINSELSRQARVTSSCSQESMKASA